MIGQAVLSSTANNGDGGYSRSIGEILASSETPSSSLKALFDVLTRDLLNQLRPTLRDFLRDTCVLRVLSPAACDALTGKSGTSAAILNRLNERALFTTEIGKSNTREMRQRRAPQRLYRYHALFQEYLCSQLEPAQALKMHARAAEFYRANNDLEAALYHAKTAGNVEKAAEDIEQLGETVLHAGRLDTLAAWIHELPPTLLLKHPRLQLYLGDISRMKNRFSEALAWYSHAEAVWRSRGDRAGIGQALRAKAMIHLDTMQPALGQALLEQALALAEGIADQLMQARTLELLAENKLNLGQPDEAQKLLAQAQTLKTDKSSEDALSVRVKIRTGHLQEAKTILEAWAEAEQREAVTDRSHRSYRETQLLLAFMHVLLGNLDQALRCANDGVALGERLRSPFISAMAQVRLGDIWQVKWFESLSATTSAPGAYSTMAICLSRSSRSH
jgi:ATP/maltotriose-dependent transcriptional regulator MalT